MATSLKRIAESQRMSGSNAKPEKQGASWKLHLSLGQLVITWSVMAGMMVMVFLFGVSSGREQGIRLALDKQGDQIIRLPINRQTSSPALPSLTPPQTAAGVVNQLVNEQLLNDFNNQQGGNRERLPLSATKNTASNEISFDFSPQAVVANNDLVRKGATTEKPLTETGASFASKPAGEASLLAETNSKTSLSTTPALQNNGNFRSGNLARSTTGTYDSSSATQEDAAGNSSKTNLNAKTGTSSPSGLQARKKEQNPPEVESKKTSGWYVQLMATPISRDAQALANKARKAGFPAQISQARVQGVLYFRVISGPYISRPRAELKMKELKNQGIAKGSPFLKHLA